MKIIKLHLFLNLLFFVTIHYPASIISNPFSKLLFLNPVSGDSSDFVLWKIANDFLLVKYNGIFHYLPRPPPDSGGSSRNTANRHFHFFISIL